MYNYLIKERKMSDENNFDLSKIMDAAKQMQETLEQAQEKIKSTEFEVSVGAGAVTLVMGGDYKLKSLKISDDARGHAGLETLLISAFSDAVDKITEDQRGRIMDMAKMINPDADTNAQGE